MLTLLGLFFIVADVLSTAVSVTLASCVEEKMIKNCTFSIELIVNVIKVHISNGTNVRQTFTLYNIQHIS